MRYALEKLLILSGLRPLKTLIRREVEKMPIALNLHDNEFFCEAFEEGVEKGMEIAILMLDAKLEWKRGRRWKRERY